MNIYNLNKEELKQVRKEFVKTSFGQRITVFGCLIPLLLMLVSLVLMLGEFFYMILDEGTGNFYLVFIIASINLVSLSLFLSFSLSDCFSSLFGIFFSFSELLM